MNKSTKRKRKLTQERKYNQIRITFSSERPPNKETKVEIDEEKDRKTVESN